MEDKNTDNMENKLEKEYVNKENNEQIEYDSIEKAKK